VKIAVLSDTHNRSETVRKALGLLEGRGVEFILHCGDIEDPEMIRLFPAHTHFVFGNCDTERPALRRAIADLGATLHEPFGVLELPQANIAFLHGDDSGLLRDLEQCDHFDFVFHGHTHIPAQRRAGKTLVINPGALHRARPKTMVVLDLACGELESIEVSP
jgi:putative phosphoesterase